ncbi:MAG: fumarylacetoacetase [Nostocoides sp.]
MTSTAHWPHLPADHPFGDANLPYGVFSHQGRRRVGVRLGDAVLDLAGASPNLGLGEDIANAWAAPSLNAFLTLGHTAWDTARDRLVNAVRERASWVTEHLIELAEVQLHLPLEVADYVDFYASEHHATNVGRIFRPHTDPLPANWKHLPIGYHGRSGTIVLSDTPIRRPSGQRRPVGDQQQFGPSIKLDIEVELGFIVGGASRIGEPIGIDSAAEHLFGVVLLNDWSARDIQAWEYVPLGPFLGKSFATSISPWVVPMAALAQARRPLNQHDPVPLPYLRSGTGDFTLEVHLTCELNDTAISSPEYADMYWSPEQMLAHMSVNGASVRPGDLFGSGTISGPSPDQRGSLLELTWDGAEPITLADGTSRGFLEDGDTVAITGWAPGADGARIGFGAVRGTIAPG